MVCPEGRWVPAWPRRSAAFGPRREEPMRFVSHSPLVALMCLIASAAPAKADIIFCNHFPQTVYVAIAYPQDTDIWLSRGWLSVPTGECRPFDTALVVHTFYYRAESERYRLPNGKRATMSWGDDGDRSFAVWESDNFQYYDAERRVLSSTLLGFSKGLEIPDDGYDVTVNFRENAGADELLKKRPR
jgi:hypothetical protein